jgi:hypothetical protein
LKAVPVDARRYAWCHGHGLWIMGLPVATFIEDMYGALAADQHGIVRVATREIGEACAVTLTIMLFFERPIPPPAMRASWALNRLDGHELADLCRELVRSDTRTSSSELVAKCERLLEQVQTLVGRVPDVLSPEGYFPALAAARGWLKLLEAVGEEDFLPRDWTAGG